MGRHSAILASQHLRPGTWRNSARPEHRGVFAEAEPEDPEHEYTEVPQTSARTSICSALLLHYLIDQGHEVFEGKGSVAALKERMQRAVQREYPETEAEKELED